MNSPSLVGRLRRPFGVTWSQKRIRDLVALWSSSRTIKHASTSAVVLHIPKSNVYRFGDANRATPVFRDFEWSIKTNESWAVVGTGSGEKSSVFDMLMGHLRIHPPPPPPLGLFPFLSDAEEPRDPHNCISIVSFANKRAVGGAFYDYTARYGAVREEDRITLRQSMFPEMINDLKSQTRISLEAPSTDYELFEYLVEKMGLRNLLDLPRIALSNGQTRRARILKALLAKPRLLLLDEPLTGLDIENRTTVQAILHELHVACNPHIIIGSGCKTLINQNATSAIEESIQVVKQESGEPVTYGPRQVLKNITWTIRQGERYHLQGTNGTPIHARVGVVTPELFDAFPRRAPGMSVWEAVGTGFDGGFERTWRVKRCWEVLAALGPGAWSAGASTATPTPTPPAPTPAPSTTLFPLPLRTSTPPSSPSLSPIPSLPTSHQRVVLLMRALVAQHPLILLDEVWSGMDARMIAAARAFLRSENGVGPTQAVVVVTHLEDEVPWGARDGVRRALLKDGELSVAEEGEK
ncbi:P-loop containing nucleoside triphosphate hydrolase protein [Mycena leptocephala]|nr:P-loop containing nucleoside triphosphate hydrolase protein [Mycena leptocephala]